MANHLEVLHKSFHVWDFQKAMNKINMAELIEVANEQVSWIELPRVSETNNHVLYLHLLCKLL